MFGSLCRRNPMPQKPCFVIFVKYNRIEYLFEPVDRLTNRLFLALEYRMDEWTTIFTNTNIKFFPLSDFQLITFFLSSFI